MSVRSHIRGKLPHIISQIWSPIFFEPAAVTARARLYIDITDVAHCLSGLEHEIMAATASDKARFFLEQSVPELQEYSRKNIFAPDEISAIAHKRSDFEHLINLPGVSTPSDYARFATYEMNLDQLRKKRCKRLAIKSTNIAVTSGPRKVFFILERGVRRFQGDLGLWLQYLEFCKAQKSNKKLVQALTQCLRLHPLRWELWVWAAKFFVETQADMNTARSYMQRGLRFCKTERRLWLEYAKLEMNYVAKIAARRKILGLDGNNTKKIEGVEEADVNDDMIALPSITAEDIDPELQNQAEGQDVSALSKMAASPALEGAIPMAIAETALKTFNNDPVFAEALFDLFYGFGELQCTRSLLQMILDKLEAVDNDARSGPSLAYCNAMLALYNVDSNSAEFPLALGRALKSLSCPLATSSAIEAQYAARALIVLAPYHLGNVDLDAAIANVVKVSVSRNVTKLSDTDGKQSQWLALLEKRLPAYRDLFGETALVRADG